MIEMYDIFWAVAGLPVMFYFFARVFPQMKAAANMRWHVPAIWLFLVGFLFNFTGVVLWYLWGDRLWLWVAHSSHACFAIGGLTLAITMTPAIKERVAQ